MSLGSSMGSGKTVLKASSIIAESPVIEMPRVYLENQVLSTWQFIDMKCIADLAKKYLSRVAIEDAVEQGEFDFSNGGTKFVPLAEHDAKYHPGGYTEKERCQKRANMAKEDPADTEIKKDDKAGSESSGGEGGKKPMTEDEKRSYWEGYLRKASDKQIDSLIDQYGDEKKYPIMCEMIKKETDRRAKADMDRWYSENGERV